MTQTVTIDINSNLLANAQLYSKKMGSDLSHFIEVLLYQVLPCENKTQTQTTSIKSIDQLSPFVQSLCGVVQNSCKECGRVFADKINVLKFRTVRIVVSNCK